MKSFFRPFGLLIACALFYVLPAYAADANNDPFPKSVDVGGVILFSTGEGSLARSEVDDQVWLVGCAWRIPLRECQASRQHACAIGDHSA